MNTRTKRNLLRIATATAVVCTAALVFVPSLASPISPPGIDSDHSISSIRIR
jgi:hypothetical protein